MRVNRLSVARVVGNCGNDGIQRNLVLPRDLARVSARRLERVDQYPNRVSVLLEDGVLHTGAKWVVFYMIAYELFLIYSGQVHS